MALLCPERGADTRFCLLAGVRWWGEAEVEGLGGSYGRVQGAAQAGMQRGNVAVYAAFDAIKDNGVVSMFPPLADRWLSEVKAQTPWSKLGLEDFSRLKKNYGADWLILQQPGVAGLDCPYENSAVRICRAP